MAEELVRKTISLSRDVYEKALVLAAKRGFKKSFSAYCEWLIEQDHERTSAGKAAGGAAAVKAEEETLRVAEGETAKTSPGKPDSDKKIGFSSKDKKPLVLLLPRNKWDGDDPRVLVVGKKQAIGG